MSLDDRAVEIIGALHLYGFGTEESDAIVVSFKNEYHKFIKGHMQLAIEQAISDINRDG